jgi:hypothetical protein
VPTGTREGAAGLVKQEGISGSGYSSQCIQKLKVIRANEGKLEARVRLLANDNREAGRHIQIIKHEPKHSEALHAKKLISALTGEEFR